MPTNEDGEFELILGNRQLLSVFFIVVVLLGVFFTMGYIVGRNSTPVATQEIASARKTEPKPIVVESPAHETPPVTPPPSAPPTETAAQQPAPIQKIDKAEKIEKKKAPEPVRPEPVVRETAKAKPPEPKKSAPPKSTPPPAAEPAGANQTYLQLVATAKAEADVMVDVLRKKGFKARNAEIPEKPGTFRVLVGPLEDGSTNKIRADLQSAGFPGDKAIKKTF